MKKNNEIEVQGPDGKVYWIDNSASMDQLQGIMSKIYPPGMPIQPKPLTPYEQRKLKKRAPGGAPQ